MGDNFTIPPPDFEGNGRDSFLPPSAEAAWMLQLIQLDLKETTLKKLKEAIEKLQVDESVKSSLVDDITPYINNAGMTQMNRSEVKVFLGEFEELWMKYKVYVFRKKFVPELNYIKTLVRGILMQQYNKSIEALQIREVYGRHHTYDVKQTRHDVSEKVKGIFGGKKQQETTEVRQ